MSIRSSLQHSFARSSYLLLIVSSVAMPVRAMDLLEAYSRARAYDASFQAAKTDRAVNEADALVARLAYLPSASANFGRESTENRDRTTYQISQPVLDLEKFATMREAAPREVLAEVGFRAKEQDLAARVTRNVLDIIRSRETIRLAQEQITALTEQATRSNRRYELGMGTLTEVSTAKVRLEQANAMHRQALAQLAIAEKLFVSLIGVEAPKNSFTPAKAPKLRLVAAPDNLIESALKGNVLVLQSRANERLAELGKQKAMAAYLPQVNAVSRTTRVDGSSDNYSGMQLSIPFGVSAANFASQYKAALAVTRAGELRRDVEDKQRLEVERLWSLVQSGIDELNIRRLAIESAELSAEGNIKSFEAGMSSAVDVLNAILTVFDTKRDQLNTLATLVEHYLSLQMTAAEVPFEALRRVQVVLLEAR